MNARRDPDRLINAFLMEGRTELADPVYDAVRATIEHKRQRVVFGPWRLPAMNKLLPMGLGAAAVIVALVVGMQFLPTAPGGAGAAPSASPSPSPAPTPEATAAAPSASAATRPTPPPLTVSFTSPQYGISLSYPDGWTVRAATEPWTDRPGVPESVDPGFDVLLHPVLGDHLFLDFASQPIGDATPDEWMTTRASDVGCTTTQPIAVDGATGLIGVEGCDAEVAAVTIDGRGYWIEFHASQDDPVAVAPYDRAWFTSVIATVQLRPEDAVDVAPSATP